MSELNDLRDDLEPGVEEELVLLADRLRRNRPVPRPAFRGDLARRIEARGRSRLSRLHVRILAAAYAVAGFALLGLGALGAGRLGPLG